MNKTKLIVTVVLVILGGIFIVTTFYRGGKKKAVLPPGVHGTVVAEVIQTSNYTYMNVEDGGKKVWIAVNGMEAKPGDSIYFSKFMEMKQFTSKELGRTFPSILFIEEVTTTLSAMTPAPAPAAAAAPMTAKKAKITRWEEVSVEKAKGGITIADLFKNPANYKGKTVIIRGVVTKFNSQIMSRNWLHIQDGSEDGGKFDLTVTSKDSVAVGKQATFTGTINLGKDFGAGYVYDVIMEEAKASDIK